MMVTMATDSPRASAWLRASRTASTGELYRCGRCYGCDRCNWCARTRAAVAAARPRTCLTRRTCHTRRTRNLLLNIADFRRFRAAQERFLDQARAGGAGERAGIAVDDDSSDAGRFVERQVRMARQRPHHERRPDGHRGL